MFMMRRYCALFFLITGLITTTAFAQSKTPRQKENLPEVLVMINSLSDGDYDQVSITLSSAVSQSTAKDYLARLVKETGWRPKKINIINDEGSSVGGESPMTMISFVTRFAVLRSTHDLTVEPIVKAFRDKTNLVIYYFVNPPFVYQGLTGTHDDSNARITLQQQGITFNYNISLKKHDFASLNLPGPTSAKASTTGTESRKNSGVSTMAVILLVIAILIVAVVAYIAAGKYVGQGTQSNKK